jgi:allantoate deiminase
MSSDAAARAILERADILGAISEETGRLTRRFAVPAMGRVNEAVTTWMHGAGMAVHQDNIGNVIGRYEARTSGARTLLLGSHLDTVRDAGKYDGPLGVLTAIACVERLHARGERLPFALEVYGFADEEGLRYHSAYLGSKVVAGSFEPGLLQLADDDGISLAEAARAFGGDPAALVADARRRDDLLGYVEVHIEQGPVLEAENLPVGVVSAIQGQSRMALTFSGVAGHAGTVPMALRQDALCAAAEFVLAVEDYAQNQPGLVATIGQLSVGPGASNVIPGTAVLSLDVRHPQDATREAACERLRRTAEAIGARRRIVVDWHLLQAHSAVACAPRLRVLLERAVAAEGYPTFSLPSGAGHDAVPISALTEVAMLFVRCKGGVSHSPAESVTADDIAAAVGVLDRFLMLVADEV